MSGTENLTQVLVPGSAEIYFPKAGAYAVYYEYQSIFDGVKYAGVKSPPDLHCQLSSKATGEYVPLASEYIEGNVYNTENQERAGVLIKSTRIDQPGVYRFACQYTEGATAPEIVLAVGPNLVWEFFNLAAKPLAALLCGAVVFSMALGVSILIIVFTAYTRHRSSQSS